MPDGRWRARLAIVVSFSAFFVFPAVPIGNTGAITIPFVLAVALALLWLPRLEPSDWWPFVWLLAPAVLSGWYVIVAGSAILPGTVPKAVAATAMSIFVLVPALRLLREGHGEQFVLGAAAAIVVHAAIGAYQVWSFERLEFPFADLMRTNPAQALLAQDPANYAEWVKRPFGLFAEPSAMAACIGPWLVAITSALFAPVRARSRARTLLLAAALGGGTWLVVASRSGLSAAVVGGCALTAIGAAFSWRRGVGARTAALVVAAVVAVASATGLAENAKARFDIGENDSWRARLDSLQLGATALAASIPSRARFLGGVGPGQSYAALNSTQLRYRTGADVTAVWSVGLNYALENGLLAVAAMLVLAGFAAWSIWASRERLAGAAFATVWATGVFLATSYVGQPALWTGLAALLSWRCLAPRAADQRGTVGPSTLDASWIRPQPPLPNPEKPVPNVP